MLRILRKYGRDYLSGEELKTYFDRYAFQYYRFLGKSLLGGRDEHFGGITRRSWIKLVLALVALVWFGERFPTWEAALCSHGALL
jgi:hypothetical protein